MPENPVVGIEGRRGLKYSLAAPTYSPASFRMLARCFGEMNKTASTMASMESPIEAMTPLLLAIKSRPSVPTNLRCKASAQRLAARSSRTAVDSGIVSAKEITEDSPAPKSHAATNPVADGAFAMQEDDSGPFNQRAAGSEGSPHRAISSATGCGIMTLVAIPKTFSNSPALARTITGEALKTSVTRETRSPKYRPPLLETGSPPTGTSRRETPDGFAQRVQRPAPGSNGRLRRVLRTP